jgi:predicted MFS family arabinose efflux permease
MVPGPAMVPIVTVASTRLVRRLGPGTVAALGSVLFAASLFWRVLLAGPEPDYLVDLLPSMLLGGAGVGLALGTLIAAGATALPDGRSGTGTAILNSGRQIASALGVAVLVTILGPTATSVEGYTAGWAVGAVLALAAGAASLVLARRTREQEVVA